MSVTITVANTGGVGVTTNRNLTVTCPATVAVGSIMVLFIAVKTHNNWTGPHDIIIPSGWTLARAKVTAYSGLTSDYNELYAYTRLRVAGDESWTFTSTNQAPARAWILLDITGAAVATPVFYATASKFDNTNPDTHTITGLTIATADDTFIAASTVNRANVAANPSGFDVIASKNIGGDGGATVYPARLTVWSKVFAAPVTTGDLSYSMDAGTGMDYCSMSLAISPSASSSASTITGWRLGSYTLPGQAGAATISHSIDPDTVDFESAARLGIYSPVMLADLAPQRGDSPGAVTEALKYSSGYYSSSYLPVIAKWPEITQSVSGDSMVGGRSARTSGDLVLLNDRTLSTEQGD